MEPKKRNKKHNPHHEHPLPGEINPNQKKKNMDAHKQADKDMIDDAELTAHSPNDDLDEGETVRLGEDNTDLV
jgi:hypothetical protein